MLLQKGWKMKKLLLLGLALALAFSTGGATANQIPGNWTCETLPLKGRPECQGTVHLAQNERRNRLTGYFALSTNRPQRGLDFQGEAEMARSALHRPRRTAHSELDFVQNLLTSTSRKSRLWRFRPELPRGVR